MHPGGFFGDEPAGPRRHVGTVIAPPRHTLWHRMVRNAFATSVIAISERELYCTAEHAGHLARWPTSAARGCQARVIA
jgi:hypothetical protein